MHDDPDKEAPKPYVYTEGPTWLYHPAKGAVLFYDAQSAKDAMKEDDQWADSPAKVKFEPVVQRPLSVESTPLGGPDKFAELAKAAAGKEIKGKKE